MCISNRAICEIGLLILGWLLIAPVQLGGMSSYAIITGNSMEPTMSYGDLAILRTTGDYSIGDVVTYQHPELGPVIHRIVASQEERFIMQGDNNDWLDDYAPGSDEIIGEMWFHIPRIGDWLRWLRTPLGITIFVVVSGAIIMTEEQLLKPRQSVMTSEDGGSNRSDFLVLFGLLIVLALMVGIPAFRNPLQAAGEIEVPYQHNGTFLYAANGIPSVYETGSAQTGQPVFFQVSDAVQFGFRYEMTTEQPGAISGTVSLDAEIASNTGWSRTLPLAPGSAFEGTTAEVVGTLNLAEIQSVIAAFEESTGTSGRNYTLHIQPHVTVLGEVAGQQIMDQFGPELEFNLDDMQMWIPVSNEDPTQISEDHAVNVPTTSAATMKIVGLEFPVRLGRWLAVSIGWIAIAGIAIMMFASTANLSKPVDAFPTRISMPTLPTVDGLAGTAREMVLPLIVFSVLALTTLATLGMLILISPGGPGS